MVMMPPSTDMVELRPTPQERTEVWCLICDTRLGTARYLNEAIVLWREHQDEERKKLRDAHAL